MNTDIYKEALEIAIASVEMEGYNLSESQKESCMKFLGKKIDKDTFIKAIKEGCSV